MGRALNLHLFLLNPQHHALKEDGKFLMPANDEFKQNDDLIEKIVKKLSKAKAQMVSAVANLLM